jgi:hypothetical protein
MEMKTVRVTKSDPPEPTEILASAILRIGAGMKRLEAGGLNEKAIIVLLHDATGLPKRDIKTIIDAQRRLAGWYCK